MKNIFRIARIELSLLFYSPVAWIVLLVFLVQSGWEYTYSLARYEQAQQMGMQMSDLTMRLFSGFSSLFPKMKEYLYLYIPLLTMGLISREINSGSIKLLYSSPIKVSEIVLGKYLAMMVYCLALVGILLGLGILSFFTIENVDILHVISGLIGLYLLVCAYSAIGLFMSSLTTYQVVAAISTLVVLAALNFVGKLWQDIAFVRDITYFLSIAGRTEEFIDGLLSSRDIFYFLVVIVLFVGLTYLKLQNERESLAWTKKTLRYLSLIVLMLGLGYLSSRPTLIAYKDLTHFQNKTLTENSQRVVSKINGPVKMTTYVNLLDANFFYGSPINRNGDLNRFDMYIRFLPEMETEYVYYYDKVDNEELYKQNPGLDEAALAKKVATAQKVDLAMFLTPEQIKKRVNLSSEGNRLVRTLEYNGKKTYLRMFDDIVRYPAEKEVTAAFKRVVDQPAKVAFLSGHRERSIQKSGDGDYQTTANEKRFRSSLINQGFDIVDVNLATQPIPRDLSTLVIADPLTPFSPLELEKIQTYLNEGGNALIAGEPGQQSLLNPMVSALGVNFQEGMLVQKSSNYAPDFILSGLAKENWVKTIGESSFAKQDSAMTSTPTAVGLNYQPQKGFKATPLLVTQAVNTWNVASTSVDRKTEVTDMRKNEEKKSMVVALALQRKVRKGEQRIVVIGDSDFMSNSEVMRQSPRTVNFSLTTELFRWFSDGNYPIDITRPESIDNQVLINDSQLSWIRLTLIGLLPALVIAAVASMLVIRKRR